MIAVAPTETSVDPTARMRFDVVVPCYNYGRFLSDAVQSVLDQDEAVRVLIVDDASTDDTACVGNRLAATDPRVTFRRHPVNRGAVATFNEGIDWASGDVFALLSADDLLMPGALARTAAAFAQRPEIVMVYGRMMNFLDGLPVEEVRRRNVIARAAPELKLECLADGTAAGCTARTFDEAKAETLQVMDARAFYRAHKRVNDVPASGTFTRTNLQKQVGGYSPTLPHAHDYEMWLRVAAHGPVGFVPRFQVARRLHRNNMSSRYGRVGDLLERARALLEIEARCGPTLPAGLLAEMCTYVASEALRVTTVALREGSAEDERELVAVAKALDPKVTRRPIWGLYLLKRAVGPQAWKVLRKCVPV